MKLLSWNSPHTSSFELVSSMNDNESSDNNAKYNCDEVYLLDIFSIVIGLLYYGSKLFQVSMYGNQDQLCGIEYTKKPVENIENPWIF